MGLTVIKLTRITANLLYQTYCETVMHPGMQHMTKITANLLYKTYCETVMHPGMQLKKHWSLLYGVVLV